jgi:hypothetical protein
MTCKGSDKEPKMLMQLKIKYKILVKVTIIYQLSIP